MIDHCSRTGVVVARDVGTLDVHRLDLDQREATLPSSEDAPESETLSRCADRSGGRTSSTRTTATPIRCMRSCRSSSDGCRKRSSHRADAGFRRGRASAVEYATGSPDGTRPGLVYRASEIVAARPGRPLLRPFASLMRKKKSTKTGRDYNPRQHSQIVSTLGNGPTFRVHLCLWRRRAAWRGRLAPSSGKSTTCLAGGDGPRGRLRSDAEGALDVRRTTSVRSRHRIGRE